MTPPRSAAPVGGSSGSDAAEEGAPEREERERIDEQRPRRRQRLHEDARRRVGPATNENARLPFSSELASTNCSRGTIVWKSDASETLNSTRQRAGEERDDVQLREASARRRAYASGTVASSAARPRSAAIIVWRRRPEPVDPRAGVQREEQVRQQRERPSGSPSRQRSRRAPAPPTSGSASSETWSPKSETVCAAPVAPEDAVLAQQARDGARVAGVAGERRSRRPRGRRSGGTFTGARPPGRSAGRGRCRSRYGSASAWSASRRSASSSTVR